MPGRAPGALPGPERHTTRAPRRRLHVCKFRLPPHLCNQILVGLAGSLACGGGACTEVLKCAGAHGGGLGGVAVTVLLDRLLGGASTGERRRRYRPWSVAESRLLADAVREQCAQKQLADFHSKEREAGDVVVDVEGAIEKHHKSPLLNDIHWRRVAAAVQVRYSWITSL